MQEPGPSQNRRRDVQMVELFWVCLMDDRELSTKFRGNFSIFKESTFSFYKCISAKLNIEGNDGQLQGSLINAYLNDLYEQASNFRLRDCVCCENYLEISLTPLVVTLQHSARGQLSN